MHRPCERWAPCWQLLGPHCCSCPAPTPEPTPDTCVCACVCVCVCVCVCPCEGQFQRASCWAVLGSRGVLQVKGPDCITFLQGACQALLPEVAAPSCSGRACRRSQLCWIMPRKHVAVRCVSPTSSSLFFTPLLCAPAPNQDSQPTTCESSRKTRRVQLPAPSSTPKVRCFVSLNPKF